MVFDVCKFWRSVEVKSTFVLQQKAAQKKKKASNYSRNEVKNILEVQAVSVKFWEMRS